MNTDPALEALRAWVSAAFDRILADLAALEADAA